VGWVDIGVNLLNTGLQLAGAPEEITDVTQLAADVTPSSFATSLASNAGRGLWNLGEGIATGDWSGIKEQGRDILQGKSGAPMQGYGMGVDTARAYISGENMTKATDYMTNEAAERGDMGATVKWGNQIGDNLFEATDRPGGYKATLDEIDSYIWEGAHGQGGIKGGLKSAWNWATGGPSMADLIRERTERKSLMPALEQFVEMANR
jgi:hypothetical protein